MLTDKLSELLVISLNKPVLIITLGNQFRSDDGVGPYIAVQINQSSKHVTVLNAEDRPENIIDKALEIKPSKTIIIDAADFEGVPGEIRLIDSKNIPDTSLSTHTLSPKILAALIKSEANSEVFFLGIQPESIQFGERLSEPVKKAARTIISCIERAKREEL